MKTTNAFVQQKIEDLLKRTTKLKKREQKDQLNDQEESYTMYFINKLVVLTILEKDKDRWFKLVE